MPDACNGADIGGLTCSPHTAPEAIWQPRGSRQSCLFHGLLSRSRAGNAALRGVMCCPLLGSPSFRWDYQKKELKDQVNRLSLEWFGP